MKIVYWADFTCPFSYIGTSNLMQACANLNIDPEFWMMAYELNPDMPMGVSESPLQQIMEKDGMTREEALEKIASVDEYAKQSGLPMNFAKAHFVNTFDAHRLVAACQKRDWKTATRLVKLLFHANFAEFELLDNKDLLLELALQAGMDAQYAQNILDGTIAAEIVRLQETVDAQKQGVESIPYYIIDGHVIDHSATVEYFENALKEIMAAGK